MIIASKSTETLLVYVIYSVSFDGLSYLLKKTTKWIISTNLFYSKLSYVTKKKNKSKILDQLNYFLFIRKPINTPMMMPAVSKPMPIPTPERTTI
jgi:hypothetical protein